MPRSNTALCDTGPLVALFDSQDSAHGRVRSALRAWPGHLITTLPVLTEAMYLLARAHREKLLWEWIARGGLSIENPQAGDIPRLRQLMEQYSDLPMDFADASLVVLAERLGLRKVFTLDRHFHLYRPRHSRAFEIFP